MKTKSLASLFVLLLFLIVTPSVFAVSLTVENVPSSVTDQEFTIQTTISGASAGQNYLRAEIYKDGTTNYFGETNNGSGWYGGSDGKQYFLVTIPDSKTPVTTSLTVRIGSPSLTEYPGSGEYKLRVKRYTSSGNAASGDQEVPVDLQITYENPTPTSTPTPIPSPTPTEKPSNTPTPSRTPTTTRTPTPSRTPTPLKTSLTIPAGASKSNVSKLTSPTPSHGPVLTAVLGASTSALSLSPTSKSDAPTPTPELKEASLSPFNPAIIFIGLGVVVLGSVGALLFKNHLHN